MVQHWAVVQNCTKKLKQLLGPQFGPNDPTAHKIIASSSTTTNTMAGTNESLAIHKQRSLPIVVKLLSGVVLTICLHSFLWQLYTTNGQLSKTPLISLEYKRVYDGGPHIIHESESNDHRNIVRRGEENVVIPVMMFPNTLLPPGESPPLEANRSPKRQSSIWQGVESSKHLQLVEDFTKCCDDGANPDEMVWLVEIPTTKEKNANVCRRLLYYLQKAYEYRVNSTSSTAETATEMKKMKIYFYEFSDSPRMQICRDAAEFVGNENVFYHRRSMVVGRHWNGTSKWIELGRIETYDNWKDFSGAPVEHISFTVRNDLVEAMEDYLQEQLNKGNDNSTKTSSVLSLPSPLTSLNIPALERPGDVICFWPWKNAGRVKSEFRNHVARLVHNLGEKYDNMTVYAGYSGFVKTRGRNEVSPDYVRDLLHYKIIVVTQPNEWEGHFRTMEALISGAFVLHDEMLTLPTGLVDGESIVIYKSAEDLEQKIKYYLWEAPEERLEIARKGWEIALTQHRSWHRAEEIVLGKLLTKETLNYVDYNKQNAVTLS